MNEAEYAIEYVYLQFIREENIAFDRDRLPDFEYGVRCARLMLEVLEDESLEYRDVTVPYNLKVRSSVRDLNQRADQQP